MRDASMGLFCLLLLGGCASIEPGDDIVAPFLDLDEDTFHCVIQPQVIEAHGCAAVGCHLESSAMLLIDTAPATCVDGVVQGAVPAGSLINFERVQPFVQSDPGSSAFWRAPTLQSSHPELIFDTSSAEANLISDWILEGTGL